MLDHFWMFLLFLDFNHSNSSQKYEMAPQCSVGELHCPLELPSRALMYSELVS